MSNGAHAIQHVVIIVQESRTFDNLFQGYPGADTQPYGYDSKGARVPLRSLPLQASVSLSDEPGDFVSAYDGGRMDGFDKERQGCLVGCPPSLPNGQYLPQYTFVPAAQIVPYVAMAQQYVLADRMFASTWDGVFENHQMLISGEDGLTFGEPALSSENPGWGCDDVDPSSSIDRLKPLPAAFPCFNYATLGDEMDRANVTWRYYASPYKPSKPDFGYEWSAFDAIAHIRNGRDWTNDVIPNSQFVSDVGNGILADVTWITPDLANSDHPRAGSANGPAWVASLVNAVGESKFWPNTAIFVVWSGWGGFYDHVPPPQFGGSDALGLRVPMLIVSPYVPQGHVSHTQYEHGSVLKFVEQAFHLPSLGGVDARGTSPAGEFNFRQHPRAFTPIHS